MTKLIAGLGNPGRVYTNSRHNIGFDVVRGLAKRHGIHFRRGFLASSLCGSGSFDSQDVILAMPLTYMNLSGGAVARLAKKHAVRHEDLLVVCDDLDLETGRLRIRKSGSSGGHKGLDSIIRALGTNDFARLRIGIGRPDGTSANRRAECGLVANYVLSGFSRQERSLLEASIESALDCCETWVTDGIDTSMNLFNKKKEKLNEEV